MRLSNLILNCFVKRDGDLWIAACTSLCLAAQSECQQEARNKLDRQINDYVNDAFADPEHTDELLTGRAAPLSQRLYFQWLRLIEVMRLKGLLTHGGSSAFTKVMPVRVAV